MWRDGTFGTPGISGSPETPGIPGTPGGRDGISHGLNGFSAFSSDGGLGGLGGHDGHGGPDGGFGDVGGHAGRGGFDGFDGFGGSGGPGGSGGSGGEDADGHDELRMAVGALALDALDPEEAVQVRAHLATCPECEAEYQSFLGVRGVMDAALVGGISRTERHQAHVVERRGRNSGVGSAPRRRRLAIVLSGVAAALIIGGAGAAGVAIGSHQKTIPVASSQLPPVSNAHGVTASLRYQQVDWGTWVQVTMSHVPPDYSCSLMAYDKQGREYPVSSWRSAEGRTTVTAPGAVALAPSEIDHFEVEMGPQQWGPHPWSLAIPMTS